MNQFLSKIMKSTCAAAMVFVAATTMPAAAATCDQLKSLAGVIRTQIADIKAGKVSPKVGFDIAATAALAIASADNQAKIKKVSADLGNTPNQDQVFGAFKQAEAVMLEEAGKIGGNSCKE